MIFLIHAFQEPWENELIHSAERPRLPLKQGGRQLFAILLRKLTTKSDKSESAE